MPVYRVTIHPAGNSGATIAGDFIASDPAEASRHAGVMASHPLVAPLLAGGFSVIAEPSPTDPRFAANYEGPAVHVSAGGQC